MKDSSAAECRHCCCKEGEVSTPNAKAATQDG